VCSYHFENQKFFVGRGRGEIGLVLCEEFVERVAVLGWEDRVGRVETM